jgi:dihydroxyacetone kinase-like predicted kinase
MFKTTNQEESNLITITYSLGKLQAHKIKKMRFQLRKLRKTKGQRLEVEETVKRGVKLLN